MSIEQGIQRISDYVQILAYHMHLKDWDIRIDPQLSEEGASASITCTDGRKIATLFFGRGFFDESPEHRRHTLVHELIHIHFWGSMMSVQTLKESLGLTPFDIFWRGFLQQVELGVDGLADALAPLLPTMEEREDAQPEGESEAEGT